MLPKIPNLLSLKGNTFDRDRVDASTDDANDTQWGKMFSEGTFLFSRDICSVLYVIACQLPEKLSLRKMTIKSKTVIETVPKFDLKTSHEIVQKIV